MEDTTKYYLTLPPGVPKKKTGKKETMSMSPTLILYSTYCILCIFVHVLLILFPLLLLLLLLEFLHSYYYYPLVKILEG